MREKFQFFQDLNPKAFYRRFELRTQGYDDLSQPFHLSFVPTCHLALSDCPVICQVKRRQLLLQWQQHPTLFDEMWSSSFFWNRMEAQPTLETFSPVNLGRNFFQKHTAPMQLPSTHQSSYGCLFLRRCLSIWHATECPCPKKHLPIA